MDALAECQECSGRGSLIRAETAPKVNSYERTLVVKLGLEGPEVDVAECVVTALLGETIATGPGFEDVVVKGVEVHDAR
jgi:hypothetical protein